MIEETIVKIIKQAHKVHLDQKVILVLLEQRVHKEFCNIWRFSLFTQDIFRPFAVIEDGFQGEGWKVILVSNEDNADLGGLVEVKCFDNPPLRP
jgi:hypothetical protein